jgi:hypothetical protein
MRVSAGIPHFTPLIASVTPSSPESRGIRAERGNKSPTPSLHSSMHGESLLARFLPASFAYHHDTGATPSFPLYPLDPHSRGGLRLPYMCSLAPVPPVP